MSRLWFLSLTLVASMFVRDTLAAEAAAAKCELPAAPMAAGSAHGVGWTMFSKYEARQIKHLSELPSGIRRRLQEHLIERMGERLYRRFSFFGGQVVDGPEFRRLEPNPGYKWKVPTYNLIFELRAPEVGVAHYGAAIELDATGDVIEMIGLPPAGRLALKAEISPLLSAYALACARGFDPPKTEAELRYDTEIESIVYRLTQRFRSKDGGRDHIIDVDAHSGRLLSVRWEDWYPHY